MRIKRIVFLKYKVTIQIDLCGEIIKITYKGKEVHDGNMVSIKEQKEEMRNHSFHLEKTAVYIFRE